MDTKISACLIVKNEEINLERCLASIRPHVDEIVVVDTGSSDRTPEIARRYADRFEVFTGCNDSDGLIADFSMARQRSLDLATRPWAMWVDGDDEVVGAENLASVVEEHELSRGQNPALVFFSYEYGHDEFGNVVCLQDRERLFSPKDAFRWHGPVHEVLGAVIPGTVKFRTDKVKIVHRRHLSKKIIEEGRNLRILKAHYARHGESDVRQLYYLGLEYGNVGDIGSAIRFHKRYVELSGWDDERFLACLKIADHYQSIGDHETAVEWGTKAMTVREGWAEAYFSLGKSYYYLAQRGGPNEQRHWERSVHFFKLGLSLPPTQTILFTNPLERAYEVHVFLNLALSKVGDVHGALESAETGLKARPVDAGLLANRKVYTKLLARQKVEQGFTELVANGDVSREVQTIVLDAIAGRIRRSDGSDRPDGSMLSPSIPEEIPDRMIVDMVRMLFRQLLRHDEVVSARNLLKIVPWKIRGSDEIARMSRLTDSMLSHLDDPEAYRRYYSGYKLEREAIPLPEPIRPAHGQFVRYDYLLKLLSSMPGAAVLDIGCMDGWVTNRIGLRGHPAWGVDASLDAVTIANTKALEFKTGAVHDVCLFGRDELPSDFPKEFDVVTLFEVYEHESDPSSVVRKAISLLKPGGLLVLSTPRGSWCQGVSVPFHPSWDDPSPREHVRAPVLQEVLSDLRQAGLEHISGREIPIDQSEQPTPISAQASICVHGRKPSDVSQVAGIVTDNHSSVASSPSRLDIIFYVGRGPEPWNPVTVGRNGIGGSETAVIEMSKRLAGSGHRIRVYGDCRGGLEGTFGGVDYLDVSSYKDVFCDVLVTSRKPEAVDSSHGVRRGATICWIHDIHCGGALTHERALKIDKFLCLSDWHRNNVLATYPYLHPDQVLKTRNGVDLTRFDLTGSRYAKDPRRAVYSSSPDRGMEVAVRIWPRVRERVPGAELHIFYGFQTWETCADGNQLALISSLKKLLQDYSSCGVVFHGRVDQTRLAEEFEKSGVWVYPTFFAETSCITAMEAHAAGLRMVTSPIAALNETVGPRGRMVVGDWLTLDYQNRFIDEVVLAMTEPGKSDRAALREYASANFGWDSLAAEWGKMLNDVFEEVRVNVVPPYKGVL